MGAGGQRIYGSSFVDYTFDLSAYDLSGKTASDFRTFIQVNVYGGECYEGNVGNVAYSATIKSFNASTKKVVVNAGCSGGLGIGWSSYRYIYLAFAAKTI